MARARSRARHPGGHRGRVRDVTSAAAAAASIAAFATWPLALVGLVTLASGLLLGLATKYGLVRYRWVLVKLVINVVLVTLVVLVLDPR